MIGPGKAPGLICHDLIHTLNLKDRLYVSGSKNMAEIRPFRGVRYNQSKIKNLAEVISPPYDIISPQQQDALYASSPYNFVRIEYNREVPQDTNQDNRYTRAVAYIKNWIKEGFLKQDEKAAFYLHAHSFTCQGRSYLRRDIIAAVKLEEWDRRIILPHENIIPNAKRDRMSMLYACQGNTSQVLAMYADPQKVIEGVIAEQEKGQPVMNFKDPWGEGHQVWAVTQPEAVARIEKEIARQPLYIADGHHRYDSALTYRRERAAQNPQDSRDAGYNYVMTSLIDMNDPGLVILPTHRLVRGISRSALTALRPSLMTFFELEDIDLKSPDVWARVNSRLAGLSPGMSRVSLAIYGLIPQTITILTVKDFQSSGALMPAFHGDLYKKLDVSLVDHVILEKMLGYDKDTENIQLAYTHDIQEAIDRVNNQEYQLSFLLNPVGPEIIKSIADAGDRMPRKSTYFYPKAPAGLVFYQW
jgi:uncharacterized protein (DUF1015 family)